MVGERAMKRHEAAELLTAYTAWLTTRGERLMLSAADDAAPAVKALSEFRAAHGIGDCRDDWEGLVPALED